MCCLWSLSLSYQKKKKNWRATPHQSFFWYDTHFTIYSVKATTRGGFRLHMYRRCHTKRRIGGQRHVFEAHDSTWSGSEDKLECHCVPLVCCTLEKARLFRLCCPRVHYNGFFSRIGHFNTPNAELACFTLSKKSPGIPESQVHWQRTCRGL